MKKTVLGCDGPEEGGINTILERIINSHLIESIQYLIRLVVI